MCLGICQSAVFVLSSVFWGSSRWAIIGSVPRCQGSFCCLRFSHVSLRSHAFGGRFDPFVCVALCKGWILFAVGKLFGARVAHNRRMDAKALSTPWRESARRSLEARAGGFVRFGNLLAPCLATAGGKETQRPSVLVVKPCRIARSAQPTQTCTALAAASNKHQGLQLFRERETDLDDSRWARFNAERHDYPLTTYC